MDDDWGLTTIFYHFHSVFYTSFFWSIVARLSNPGNFTRWVPTVATSPATRSGLAPWRIRSDMCLGVRERWHGMWDFLVHLCVIFIGFLSVYSWDIQYLRYNWWCNWWWWWWLLLFIIIIITIVIIIIVIIIIISVSLTVSFGKHSSWWDWFQVVPGNLKPLNYYFVFVIIVIKISTKCQCRYKVKV